MKVTPYGRLTFLVQSQSNEEVSYLVDLGEGKAGECNCADAVLRKKKKLGSTCKHLRAAKEYLVNEVIERLKEQEHGS
jgi:hypothetical protein